MKGSTEGSHGVCTIDQACFTIDKTDLITFLEEQQDACSLLKSKAHCSMLVRTCGLDQIIKISERQEHIGPQPTVLKNTVAAIIAAVWSDSRDYSATVRVMTYLG